MATKPAKFIVVHGQGGYLFSFWMGWLTECGDDPSCWTDDRTKARKYTATQIEKMRATIRGFQGDFTVEAV